MKRPEPLILAITLLVVASLAISALSMLVLATTPVARLHTDSNKSVVFNPVGSEVSMNETFAAQSSVAFHWELYGFAPYVSVSVVDPFNDTIYEKAAGLNGSSSGSGSFVSGSGTYAVEFDGLTYAVFEVSVVITYTFVSQSPLI